MATVILALMAARPAEATKYFETATRRTVIVNDPSGLSKASVAAIQRILSTIHPGMRRADVEQLMLEPDDGPQPEQSTRYKWGPGYVILVPFDQNSGLWEPQNKVNGLPKLTLW